MNEPVEPSISMHGLDIEQEIMDVFAAEISAEIDKDIMKNFNKAYPKHCYE